MSQLPDGITVNGATHYYDCEDQTTTNKAFKPISDIQALRQTEGTKVRKHRSLKGQAFKIPPVPGKLQRVSDTIIYDQERIQQMSNEKYYEEFANAAKHNYTVAPLSELVVYSFCLQPTFQGKADLTLLLEALGKGQERTISKIVSSTMSYHLSAYWNHNKAIALFVDREVLSTGGKNRYGFKYKACDMALRLGPTLINKLRNISVPKDIEKLRIRMSDIRLLAKSRGINETEFNKFIEERKPLLELNRALNKRKYATDTVPTADVSKPYEGTGFTTPDIVKPVQYITDPIQEVTEPTPDIVEPVQDIAAQTYLKSLGTKAHEIDIDLKIWFIPVTGRIVIK
jgi:hypothetical protein